jgi:hypothetical protein
MAEAARRALEQLISKGDKLADLVEDTPSPEAIVRAALERASGVSSPWGSCGCSQDIYTLASDPAEVAAIIEKAGEDRG